MRCGVCSGKMVIKATKRIFNSDKMCHSYSDLNFGVTVFGTQCIIWNDTRHAYIFYETLIASHICSDKLCHCQWSWANFRGHFDYWKCFRKEYFEKYSMSVKTNYMYNDHQSWLRNIVFVIVFTVIHSCVLLGISVVPRSHCLSVTFIAASRGFSETVELLVMLNW